MSKQYEENPSANNINFKLIFLKSLLFIAQCLESNSRIFLSPTFCVCSHTSVIVGFFLQIIDPFINNFFDSYTHKLKTAMQCRLLIDNSTLHDGPLVVGCLNFSQSIYSFIFPLIHHSSTSINTNQYAHPMINSLEQLLFFYPCAHPSINTSFFSSNCPCVHHQFINSIIDLPIYQSIHPSIDQLINI